MKTNVFILFAILIVSVGLGFGLINLNNIPQAKDGIIVTEDTIILTYEKAEEIREELRLETFSDFQEYLIGTYGDKQIIIATSN